MKKPPHSHESRDANANANAPSRSLAQLEALTSALDDVPVTDEEAAETVAALGIDVPALAAGLRARIAERIAARVGESAVPNSPPAPTEEGPRQRALADEAKRESARKIEAARAAYAAELERLARRRSEKGKDRDALLVTFGHLLAKAPPNTVAMHFHKYEAASDDELAELIRALRHLLDEDDDGGSEGG